MIGADVNLLLFFYLSLKKKLLMLEKSRVWLVTDSQSEV